MHQESRNVDKKKIRQNWPNCADTTVVDFNELFELIKGTQHTAKITDV